jgi:hypothetical protein
MVPSMGDDELFQNVSYKMHGVGDNIGDYYKKIIAKQNKIILINRKQNVATLLQNYINTKKMWAVHLWVLGHSNQVFVILHEILL